MLLTEPCAILAKYPPKSFLPRITLHDIIYRTVDINNATIFARKCRNHVACLQLQQLFSFLMAKLLELDNNANTIGLGLSLLKP